MATHDNNKRDDKKKKTILRGRLIGAQRYKLRKLLYMKYKPSELAKEIDIHVKWIYRIYIPLGCPYENDEKRNIWIVGTEFRDWYMETYRKHKMSKDEAYCVSCKKVVAIVNPVTHEKEGMKYLRSQCPECGKGVAKILTQKWRHK